MATITELEMLAKELTEAIPPPQMLAGLENVVPGSGRWVIVRIGGGTYAVRAEFDSVISGSPVTARVQNEIRGYAATVATALRFAIQVATAGRHNWIRVLP